MRVAPIQKYSLQLKTLIAKDIYMNGSLLKMRLSVFKQGTFQGFFFGVCAIAAAYSVWFFAQRRKSNRQHF